MTGIDARSFRAAVIELAAIQAQLAEASAHEHADWRRELIALRRRLQAQILAISQLLDAADPASADAATMRTLRDGLSRMRSKVALHQANWPAVTIDRADPAYQASVRGVRAANREFLVLAEQLGARR